MASKHNRPKADDETKAEQEHEENRKEDAQPPRQWKRATSRQKRFQRYLQNIKKKGSKINLSDEKVYEEETSLITDEDTKNEESCAGTYDEIDEIKQEEEMEYQIGMTHGTECNKMNIDDKENISRLETIEREAKSKKAEEDERIQDKISEGKRSEKNKSTKMEERKFRDKDNGELLNGKMINYVRTDYLKNPVLILACRPTYSL